MAGEGRRLIVTGRQQRREGEKTPEGCNGENLTEGTFSLVFRTF